MTTHVEEIAGKLTLVIPQDIASEVNVSGGSEVDLRVAAGNIIVRPLAHRKNLQELLAQVTDDNRHSEIDWGSPVGNEIW